ncbi:MAG: DNA repair protein RecO [Leptospiraceae bacterium]|nr:DNA repair protein RecO [Leptospiraceae bacterium]MCP5497252.1 DNA repair protein RecO [Leptospiraceae bacterium]
MSLKKDAGIVLSTNVSQETDVILTLIGKTQEKSKYRVKGIKKSKKRPIVAAEIGSYITLDYYQHEKNDVYNVKDISLSNRFSNIKSSYCGFLFIHYLCELMNKMLPDGEKHIHSFELIYAMLTTIDKFSYNPLVLPFFKLKILYVNGLVGNDFVCHVCNVDVMAKSGVFIDAASFELTCSDCHSGNINFKSVVKLMDKILKTNYKKALEENIPILNIIQLDKILNEYIYSYLNKELKSHEIFYNSLGVNYEFTS